MSLSMSSFQSFLKLTDINYLLRTDIQEMLCRLAEHPVYCSHTAKAYSNT